MGAIARRFAVPTHCITYIIQSRGFAPHARAGVAYVYADADVAAIGLALEEIKAKRQEVSRG